MTQLRRKQDLASSPDSQTSTDTQSQKPQTGPGGIERRRHPRVQFESSDESVSSPTPKFENDKRTHNRRAMDALRSELKYTSANDRRGRGAPLRIKTSRLVLLAISIVCGGLAAFLAWQQPQLEPEPVPVQVEQELRVPVLVASQLVTAGERISGNVLEWQDWPASAVLDDYIVNDELADVNTGFGDAIARVDLYAGEPIREQKLLRDADGHLSSSMNPGTRAVSVLVTPVAASGGFINPNDFVDVVLTHTSSGPVTTQIVLENVQVLAIGGSTGGAPEPESDDRVGAERAFDTQAIATLELDQFQSQAIISAQAMGELTLILRPTQDADQSNLAPTSGLNQMIRMTSPFWNSDPTLQSRQ